MWNWLRKWQQNASEPPTCKIIIHFSQQQFWPCYFSELFKYSGQAYVSLSVRDDAVVLVFPTQLFSRSGKAWPVLDFFLFFSSGLSQWPLSKNAETESNSHYFIPAVVISLDHFIHISEPAATGASRRCLLPWADIFRVAGVYLFTTSHITWALFRTGLFGCGPG